MGFKLGDTVYIKTDAEQVENIVVAKTEFYGGSVVYKISCNGGYLDVYECELNNKIDELKKLGLVTQREE